LVHIDLGTFSADNTIDPPDQNMGGLELVNGELWGASATALYEMVPLLEAYRSGSLQACPSTRSPSTMDVGVGFQPRATRAASSASASGRSGQTATAVTAPSQVVS
jgi:hypothetical protein